VIEQVCSAIKQKYLSDAILMNALPGGLYFQQAPQSVSFPFAVFTIDGITQEEIMGGATDNITSIEIQFEAFSDDLSGGSLVASIAAALSSTYDWKELAINGYRYVKMQKVSVEPILYEDSIWQITTNYELWLQKE
tara:strand:- start:371 stop:778 length:408 start_codon:yes stop_codon:yes gene_type:complete